MVPTPDSFTQAKSLIDNSVKFHLLQVLHIGAPQMERMAPEFGPLILTSPRGGKRLRALAAGVGALSAGRGNAASISAVFDQELLALGAALEFYQSAALIHDDVVDRSPQRRGLPSFHVALTQIHDQEAWQGDSAHFGTSGAILAGDLLLAAADSALAQSATKETYSALYRRFSQMTTEVAYGQYLDLRGSATKLDSGDSLRRALQVIRLKSARYSVSHPVVLGALASQADSKLAGALEQIFEPAGMAFQLRDDDLGVFGDPSITGKPSGADIAEKKRTALIALTFAAACPKDQERLNSMYSAPTAPSETDIAWVRDMILRYGREDHEALISQHRHQATTRLEESGLEANAKRACSDLIEMLLVRES